MNNLIVRSISGIVFVVIMAGLVAYPALQPFFRWFLFLMSFLAVLEYVTWSLPQYSAGRKYYLATLTAVAFVQVTDMWHRPDAWSDVLVLIGFWMAHIAISLVAAKVSITDLAKESFGISYILIGFATTVGLAQFTIHKGAPYFQQTPEYFNGNGLLFVLALIWINDSFAYLVGRFLGRTKAVPDISPAKTVEGYAGGLMATLLGAFALSGWLMPGINGHNAILFGIVISISASLGDLLESSMKREAGVKDSGNIMPGHGGVLDRFDATLLVSPILMAVLLLLHYN